MNMQPLARELRSFLGSRAEESFVVSEAAHTAYCGQSWRVANGTELIAAQPYRSHRLEHPDRIVQRGGAEREVAPERHHRVERRARVLPLGHLRLVASGREQREAQRHRPARRFQQPYPFGLVGRALEQIRETQASDLLVARPVGRAGLPSTVMGLLFHGAEHTLRHAGQFITTLKIVQSR